MDRFLPRLALGLTWLALAAPTAHAERMIGYREALEAAEHANPSLVTAVLTRDQAEAGLAGARGIFDPDFSVTSGWNSDSQVQFIAGTPNNSRGSGWNVDGSVSGSLPTGTSYSLSGGLNWNDTTNEGFFGRTDQQLVIPRVRGSLTQQILKGHRLAYNTQNITRARTSLDQAEIALERARQQALSETAQAYWSWVYQVRVAEIAAQSVATAEEALRVGGLRVDAGELAPVERTRLQAALIQARSAQVDADNLARQAADQLLLAMGEATGQHVLPSTAVGEVPPLHIDAAAAAEVAVAQNLDLAQARAVLEASRVDWTTARHATLPSLSATVAGGYGTVEDRKSDLRGTNSDLSISGTFSVPIGNRAARGEARRSLYDVHAQELEVSQLERSIRAQVEQQVRVLEGARTQVELSDVNLRLAEETLVAEEALFEAGRAILKDVLEARTELDRSRGEVVRARKDYRLAQVELLRLQGQLDADVP